MGRVTFEIFPAGNRAFFQLRQRTNDLKVGRIIRIDPDRQRQTPETLLGDHPVAHVGQPFSLTFAALDAVGQPADLIRHRHDFVAPVHVDEPFINQTEHQFIPRAPAERIDVRILFIRNQQMFFFQLRQDQIDRFWVCGLSAGEFPKSIDKSTVLSERSEADKSTGFAQLMVDVTAARRDMNDSGPFTGNDIRIPFEIAAAVDYTMTRDPAFLFNPRIKRHTSRSRLRRQIVERAGIFPADHLGSLDRPFDLVTSDFLEQLPDRFQFGHAGRPVPFGPSKPLFELFGEPRKFQIILGEIIDRTVSLRLQFHILQIRIDGSRDVAGQRPGRRRPNQKEFRRRRRFVRVGRWVTNRCIVRAVNAFCPLAPALRGEG